MHLNKIKLFDKVLSEDRSPDVIVCYPPWGTGLNAGTTLKSWRALGLGEPQQPEPWADSRVWALCCGLSREGSWAESLGMAQLLLSTWKWFINKGVDLVSPRVLFCNTSQSSELHLSSLSHGSYFCHQQSSGCLRPNAALHPALIFHSNRGEAQNPKEERKVGKVGHPLLETMNIHNSYYL